MPFPTPFANVSMSGTMPCASYPQKCFAGASPAGLHLVGDEQDAAVVELLVELPEHAVGGCGEATDTLDRLGDERSHVAGRRHVEELDQIVRARVGVRLIVEVAER